MVQGHICDQQGRRIDEVACYRDVLQLDPDRDDARLRLVNLLLQLSQAAEAWPHLEYLLRAQPNNAEVWHLAARCQDLLGNQEECDRFLAVALARNPKFAPALADQGKRALARGEVKQALDLLQQAVQIEPGDYETHYQLFLALERNHQKEEAESEQHRLEQIQDDMRRIQDIATQLMPTNPHDARLHFEAGMIAMRAGSLKEGARWLESAVREDPRYLPAHRALADFYQRTGSPGRAARHRRFAEEARTTPGAGHEALKMPAPDGTTETHR
jgi:Tfp pilus assembly protein PilF